MPNRNRIVHFALLTATVIGGLAFVALSGVLFMPLFSGGRKSDEASAGGLKLPTFDYSPWYGLPVQDARVKPFQTACTEAVRQICGSARFAGQDPVAIVLSWLFEPEPPAVGGVDWEQHRFLLCDHHGLRRIIFRTEPSETPPDSESQATTDRSLLQQKYVSPAELRRSAGFDKLLEEGTKLRTEFQGRAHQHMSKEQLKAEEVGRRLMLFDAIRGRRATRLFANAIVGGKFVGLRERAAMGDESPDQILQRLVDSAANADPWRLVPLDDAPGSAWFSRGELAALRSSPERWKALQQQRLTDSPTAYLAPERLRALQSFRQRLDAGQGDAALAEVAVALHARHDTELREVEQALAGDDREHLNRLLAGLARSERDRAALAAVLDSDKAVLEQLQRVFSDADAQVLDRLRRAAEAAAKGQLASDSPEWRLGQVDYLESLYPDLYRQSPVGRDFPAPRVERILASHDDVRRAYTSRRSPEFDAASARFFAAIREAVGDRPKYPGTQTLGLELRFNRWQPFRWAWVLMLLTLVAFTASLIGNSRWCYVAGFVLYGASLLVQTFGFATRMIIAGRAPVANMYESVIFVAFMSAVFALVLELIYRRRLFALAGALVATLGLILADQLPLALDPKINPIVPVLRTNYWLTVHVLTIVASYAGGTLAWGLGNLALGLLAFGRSEPETVKTLSRYTYRAMQIAVVLLAAGTFLGGWWAAEAWGRFWGWDPKEVSALIALICYVIPLHARYIGWVRDFGLAVSAVLCYASILLSWYVVNFVLAAGLHSYGFSDGGGLWVLWACLLNLEWVLAASLVYLARPPADLERVSQTTKFSRTTKFS